MKNTLILKISALDISQYYNFILHDLSDNFPIPASALSSWTQIHPPVIDAQPSLLQPVLL